MCKEQLKRNQKPKGSVLCKWKDKRNETKKVKKTTANECLDFHVLIKSLINSWGGQIKKQRPSPRGYSGKQHRVIFMAQILVFLI